MTQSSQAKADEYLELLIAMTNQTNLVAIDKVLASIRQSHLSYARSATRCSAINERIHRAIREVGNTLPEEKRATYEINLDKDKLHA